MEVVVRTRRRRVSGVGLGGSSLCEFLCEVVFVRDVTDMYCRLLLAFAAYFGLGAYYNYSTYGASGADLIPYVSKFWLCFPSRILHDLLLPLTFSLL
jgi:hypothetical protein